MVPRIPASKCAPQQSTIHWNLRWPLRFFIAMLTYCIAIPTKDSVRNFFVMSLGKSMTKPMQVISQIDTLHCQQKNATQKMTNLSLWYDHILLLVKRYVLWGEDQVWSPWIIIYECLMKSALVIVVSKIINLIIKSIQTCYIEGFRANLKPFLLFQNC